MNNHLHSTKRLSNIIKCLLNRNHKLISCHFRLFDKSSRGCYDTQYTLRLTVRNTRLSKFCKNLHLFISNPHSFRQYTQCRTRFHLRHSLESKYCKYEDFVFHTHRRSLLYSLCITLLLGHTSLSIQYTNLWFSSLYNSKSRNRTLSRWLSHIHTYRIRILFNLSHKRRNSLLSIKSILFSLYRNNILSSITDKCFLDLIIRIKYKILFRTMYKLSVR